MLHTVAVRGYRSLRDLVLPLGRLTVVTGANGTGKSSLYRALRLLADCGRGEVIGSFAREGGVESAMWAGPEHLGGARPRHVHEEGAHEGERRVHLGTTITSLVFLSVILALVGYLGLSKVDLEKSRRA